MATIGTRIAMCTQCLLAAAGVAGESPPGNVLPGDVHRHGAACDGRAVNNRIAGTVFEYGIHASGSPGDLIRALQVRDNTVSDSKIDGIKSTYADGAILCGNTTSGNGGQGTCVTIGTSIADVRDNLAH